jgi:hypothetical protein
MREFKNFSEIKSAVGTKIGVSAWVTVTQARINRFAVPAWGSANSPPQTHQITRRVSVAARQAYTGHGKTARAGQGLKLKHPNVESAWLLSGGNPCRAIRKQVLSRNPQGWRPRVQSAPSWHDDGRVP